MAKNRGIITATQDAITDVAKTGIEGAKLLGRSYAISCSCPFPANRALKYRRLRRRDP